MAPGRNPQPPQLMEELQHNSTRQFGFAMSSSAERIGDLFYFRSIQIPKNLQENLETFPIQLLPYFMEIFAPNQEVS